MSTQRSRCAVSARVTALNTPGPTLVSAAARAVAESLEQRVLLAFSNPLVNDPSTDTNANVNFRNSQRESATLVIPGTGGAQPTVLASFNDTGSRESGNGHHNVGYAKSTDGGASFTDLGAFPDSLTGFEGDDGDTTLVRTTSGRIYLCALSTQSNDAIVLSGWTGTGFSLSTPALAGIDKPWMTVDDYSGTGQENVYVSAGSASSSNSLQFAFSTDHGFSFTSMTVLSATSNVFYQGANLVVAPDHSIHLTYTKQVTNPSDGTVTSTIQTQIGTFNGTGVSFGSPILVAALHSKLHDADLNLGGFRTNGYPQLAVNPNVGSNGYQMFAVFGDDQSLTDVDKADIMLAQSNDTGATWNTIPLVQVNDDNTTNAQWQPTLAIKPDGSQLFVGWYDRRTDPSDNLINVYGRIADVSTSSALSFAQSSFRISNASWNPYFGFDSAGNSTNMGDYDEAAADNTGFYFSWGDSRDGHPYATGNHAEDIRLQRIPSVFGTNSTSKGDNIVIKRDPTDTNYVEVLVNSNVAFRDLYANGTTITIDGGDGSDTISVDTVNGAIATDLIIYGGAGNDTITAGAGNDTIYGGADTDSILGGAGNDSLDGGTGTDFLDGGTGSDTISYATRTNGFGVDLSASPQTSTEDGSIFNFENVTGSLGNDTITGNSGANALDGWQSGTDNISGGVGDDSITVYGANTNATGTTVSGGDGIDTLTYIDSKQTQTSNSYSHSVSGSTATIAHTGFRDVQYSSSSFESVVMKTFGATDSLTVSSTFSGTPVAVNGGGANDTITVADTSGREAIVDAGTGANVVILNNSTKAVFSASQNLDKLQVGSGAVARVATTDDLTFPGDKLITITTSASGHGLILDSSAKLDLTDQDMIVNGTTKGTIQTLINAARNGGTWNGNGITSTSAQNEPNHNGTLGVLDNVEFVDSKPFVTGERGFDGVKITDGSVTAVLVKYTYYGDTEFDGRVTFDDYVRTDNGFNNHIVNGGWLNGDFNADGDVDFDDYVLIDLANTTQSGTRSSGGGGHSWADVAQLEHFPLSGYEQYLIDALAQLGIHVTDHDFHP